VLRVNHSIENIRVGQSLDYDRVTMEVWTNGALSPKEAVKQAADILMGHLVLFTDFRPEPVAVQPEIKVEAPLAKQKTDNGLSLSIEDLELSARSSNCLRKAGINTVAELIGKDINELMQIKNFGRKSADEINEKLAQYGLGLRIPDSSVLPDDSMHELDEVNVMS
jgi:DNA-directed RNA polymerase subunit alpha